MPYVESLRNKLRSETKLGNCSTFRVHDASASTGVILGLVCASSTARAQAFGAQHNVCRREGRSLLYYKVWEPWLHKDMFCAQCKPHFPFSQYKLRQYLSPYSLILLPISTIFIKHFFSFVTYCATNYNILQPQIICREYEETINQR